MLVTSGTLSSSGTDLRGAQQGPRYTIHYIFRAGDADAASQDPRCLPAVYLFVKNIRSRPNTLNLPRGDAVASGERTLEGGWRGGVMLHGRMTKPWLDGRAR